MENLTYQETLKLVMKIVGALDEDQTLLGDLALDSFNFVRCLVEIEQATGANMETDSAFSDDHNPFATPRTIADYIDSLRSIR